MIYFTGLQYNGGGFTSFFNNIIFGHGTIIMHTLNPTSIGKDFTVVSTSIYTDKLLEALNEGKKLIFLDTTKDGMQFYRAYIPFYIGNKASMVWLSGTSLTKAEVDSFVLKEMLGVLIITVFGLIVLTLFSYFVINKALKPLHYIKTAAEELANGNLHVNLSYSGNDEIGLLAAAFLQLTDTFKLLLTKINSMSEALNAGDYSYTINEDEFYGGLSGCCQQYQFSFLKSSSGYTHHIGLYQ